MSECVCRVIKTSRVGTLYTRSGEVLGRFALDCPVHGIISDRSEEPVIEKEIAGSSPKERRKRRLARAKERENIR